MKMPATTCAPKDPCNASDPALSAWYAKLQVDVRKAEEYINLLRAKPKIFAALDKKFDDALGCAEGDKVVLELTVADANCIIGKKCSEDSTLGALLQASNEWAKCLDERGFK